MNAVVGAETVDGWFGDIVKSFSHVLKHVAAIAADVAMVSFGLPPGAGLAAAELLMHAHAGNPKAKAHIARIAQDPHKKKFLQHVQRHLKAHPEFDLFRQTAKAGIPGWARGMGLRAA